MNLRGLLVALSLVLGSLVFSPPRALAEDEATQQARKHYQEAQKQFDLGMWDVAIAEFSKAYELRPDPTFLFNMAQAYRRAGNARRAIDLYKNYLIKVPKSPQRAEVEDRIQNLQKQLDEEERNAKRVAPAQQPSPTVPAPSLTPEPASPPGEPVAPPPLGAASSPVATPTPAAVDAQATATVSDGSSPSAPVTPDVAAGSVNPAPGAAATTSPEMTATKTLPVPDSGSRRLRIAGLVTGAAGVAGIGAGIFFTVRTNSLASSVGSAVRFNSADARAGKLAETLQWVCYGAGGAAVVAGALLYWKGRARNGVPVTVSFVPVLAPTNAGLLARGAF